MQQNDPEYEFYEIILEPDTNSVPKRQRIIVEPQKEDIMRLYPNPAYDYVTVVFSEDVVGFRSCILQLINALGQVIYQQETDMDVRERLIGLGVYPPGNYSSDSLAYILLDNMEQTNYSQPGARARSILRMKGRLAYHEPILLPGMGTPKQVMAMPEVTTGQDTTGSIMNLYPNPANTILTIEYKVENQAGELLFQILDIKGSLIRSIPLANHKGKATIGLSGIPAGTFFGVLRMNGTLLQSKKFSIAK